MKQTVFIREVKLHWQLKYNYVKKTLENWTVESWMWSSPAAVFWKMHNSRLDWITAETLTLQNKTDLKRFKLWAKQRSLTRVFIHFNQVVATSGCRMLTRRWTSGLSPVDRNKSTFVSSLLSLYIFSTLVTVVYRETKEPKTSANLQLPYQSPVTNFPLFP